MLGSLESIATERTRTEGQPATYVGAACNKSIGDKGAPRPAKQQPAQAGSRKADGAQRKSKRRKEQKKTEGHKPNGEEKGNGGKRNRDDSTREEGKRENVRARKRGGGGQRDPKAGKAQEDKRGRKEKGVRTTVVWRGSTNECMSDGKVRGRGPAIR